MTPDPTNAAGAIDALRLVPFSAPRWPALWTVLEPVFRAGETYAVPRDISANTARAMWCEAPRECWLAMAGNAVLGSYYIKPNHPGAGAHVCNCGYVVTASARGHGIAAAMCEHSQDRARALGFAHMQFNLVAASNAGAVRLWQRQGFAIVGTLPGAFRHPALGDVDAHVMYKSL